MSHGFHQHDSEILFGKPTGTYFFRRHNHGQTALVFCLGGTKIGIVTLLIDSNGSIEITTPGKRRSFDSETEFLRTIKEDGLPHVSAKKQHIKLGLTVNEFNCSIPSLKHLSIFSILTNAALRDEIWDDEDKEIPIVEALKDDFYEIGNQIAALEWINGPMVK